MIEILNLLNPWWSGHSFKTGIERLYYKKRLLSSLKNTRAVLIVGSRRVGKTTLIYQIISELLKKTSSKQVFYALLDHPQLASYKILDLVHDLRKHFSLDRKTKLYLFFDEIQYVKNWEQEVKALVDTENVKVFLSGSATSTILLKSPYLTGRIEKVEIYPLDFGEFLSFKKIKISSVEDYKWEKYTDEYLITGGYPEYVLDKNPGYFSDLVNNILFKDIVNLYQVRNPENLREILLLLADRVGSQTSYSKLAKIVSLKVDTVKEYIFYLKNTFLVEELSRFSSSRASRIYGPKKFYTSDNGLLFHLSGKLSAGSALEQTLFNFLKRSKKKVGFYYENQREIDFVVDDKEGIELWEAKYKRELDFEKKLPFYYKIANLIKAKKIVFVTYSLAKEEKVQDLNIEYLPLWKLLKNNKLEAKLPLDNSL